MPYALPGPRPRFYGSKQAYRSWLGQYGVDVTYRRDRDNYKAWRKKKVNFMGWVAKMKRERYIKKKFINAARTLRRRRGIGIALASKR